MVFATFATAPFTHTHGYPPPVMAVRPACRRNVPDLEPSDDNRWSMEMGSESAPFG